MFAYSMNVYFEVRKKVMRLIKIIFFVPLIVEISQGLKQGTRSQI